MKKIALINDLSSFGKCSLTAAIPVVSVMGIQACPLPTAILTAQTGFTSYECDDYTSRMDTFTRSWQTMGVSFDGIHSGYLADAAQIEKVIHFLDAFQKQDTIYLADPVLGDNGHCFKAYSDGLLDGMRQLCQRATVCTPNLTELCLLTDTVYEELTTHAQSVDYTDRIRDVAMQLLKKKQHPLTVVVTGILRTQRGQRYMGNLIVHENGTSSYMETPYTGTSFSGTGDLFASVVCASLVRGDSVDLAVQRAVSFLQPAIEQATAEHVEPNHGVNFEKFLYKLMED